MALVIRPTQMIVGAGCPLGVATTSQKLLQISQKLSFLTLMMKPNSIFWSDESPGRTRSAHVACAQLLSRLAGHSVCALGIHPIKKSKWVSSLGFKNLAFQKFAVISMIVQFFLATPNVSHSPIPFYLLYFLGNLDACCSDTLVIRLISFTCI